MLVLNDLAVLKIYIASMREDLPQPLLPQNKHDPDEVSSSSASKHLKFLR
jgi:hypothetical protein